MSQELDEHRVYLHDRVRLAAYERALRAVVRRGDVVVDFGAGTGILGMLACRAGAARVYAIEHSAIAGLGRQIARANGLDGTITVVRGNSRDVRLPERADVLVCDQLGAFGLDAGVGEVAQEARARFLRPGGIMVPDAVQLSIAAVEHRESYQRVSSWLDAVCGFDVSAAGAMARNTAYRVQLEARDLLTTPVCSEARELLSHDAWPVHVATSREAQRDGVVHGIGGWFVAQLAPGISMTNGPTSPDRIARSQIFLPLREPVAVARGGAIELGVTMSSPDVLSWTAAIIARDGQRQVFRHSALEGMLLSHEDLARTAPAHRPSLSAMGAARLTVLSLCDAQHSVDAIESTVYREHRDLFLSRDEASSFVARILGQ
ncbi:MAG TPA: 50S ribosomal protein L11 methyltransferase, partial [Vicinamibacterales bacterium]|nr:50S ribosomal protein L11 methyltransferase [Vicinamibacterales bacterium]